MGSNAYSIAASTGVEAPETNKNILYLWTEWETAKTALVGNQIFSSGFKAALSSGRKIEQPIGSRTGQILRKKRESNNRLEAR